MERWEKTSFLDYVRYLIIACGTMTAMFLLGARNHWATAAISAIPTFFVMFCLADVVTLPLYFMTPEQRVTSVALKAIEKDDFDMALRTIEAYEHMQAERSKSRHDVGFAKSNGKQNDLVRAQNDELLADNLRDLALRCEELIGYIDEMIHDESLDPEELADLLRNSKAEVETLKLTLAARTCSGEPN